ncbi:hypothetical protein [Bacillus sp. AFS017274]|uniref:hypothetical protein n=1 Tax=Bacillus sp. AFS017274 TaxID=2033488 RepID=UPI0011554F8A|nr:hypothetical protein [Bacillus sp. AFS017274]
MATELRNHKAVKKLKWVDVALSSSIIIVLTFLPPYLDRIGFSFWLKTVCGTAVLFSVIFIVLPKIKFLQKSVTKKVGWLILISVLIFVLTLGDLIND